MTKKLSDIGEFGLIGQIRKAAVVGSDVVQGIGDDAAVLKAGKETLLLTTDMLLEGVHFTRSTPPELVGRKALACNISDVAAMGGVPTFAVVSLGLPDSLPVEYIRKIYQGMNRLAAQFDVSIVGGDTNKNSKLVINVALLGKAVKGKFVTRSGARKGDVIFVSGRLGNSLRSGRHLAFTPRVKEAQFLMAFHPTAMIDISDGLAADLGHILEESGTGAYLYVDQIPLQKGVALKNALHDGEDFELLFTLPAAQAKKLTARKQKFPFYAIGQIVEKNKGLALIDRQGQKTKISARGFRHF